MSQIEGHHRFIFYFFCYTKFLFMPNLKSAKTKIIQIQFSNIPSLYIPFISQPSEFNQNINSFSDHLWSPLKEGGKRRMGRIRPSLWKNPQITAQNKVSDINLFKYLSIAQTTKLDNITPNSSSIVAPDKHDTFSSFATQTTPLIF